MHFTLPLTINDRRDIFAELYATTPQNSASYIVVFPDTNAVSLVSIDKLQFLKCFVEQAQDIPLQSLSYNTTYTKGVVHLQLLADAAGDMPQANTQLTATDGYYHELDEKLLLAKQKAQTVEAHAALQQSTTETIAEVEGEFTLSIVESASLVNITAAAWQLESKSAFVCDSLTLEIQFVHGNNTYTYTTKLCLAHPSTFLGLALDFGSESSQMATLRYDTEHGIALRRPQVSNLFEHVMNYHVNQNWVKRKVGAKYYQEEPDDNFYKSVFFMREALSEDYTDLELEPLIKEQANNLIMLVDTDSSAMLMDNRHYQLPNLKISHKHADVLKRYKFQMKLNGYSYTSNLDELQGMVTNNILRTFVSSVLQSDSVRYSKAQRNVRLMLLVPNIYDMRQVSKVQRSLNLILADLAQTEYANRIKHWEVLTISESDAAFIGYLSKPSSIVRTNSDYVIVDVGKGTTDFSILHTGSTNVFDLQPIYRNGFAGAGNLITHAVFETIVHFIREHSTASTATNYIRDTIIAMLDGSDLALKNSFFAEVERLKFNFKHDNQAQTKTQWLTARSGDFTWQNIVEKNASSEQVINLLKQVGHGADFYGYINDVCEAISEKIVAHLTLVAQHKPDFICAGVVLTGRGFLFDPLAKLVTAKIASAIKIDASHIHMLVGNELKDVCIKGVFDSSIKINAEAVGHPIQIVKTTTAATPKVAEVAKAAKDKAYSWIDRWFLRSIENDIQTASKMILQDNKMHTASLANSTVAIGCTMYKVGNQRLLSNIQEAVHTVSIDYTSDGYKVRRMVGNTVDCVAPLLMVEDYTNTDQRMVIPSLFPNYMQEMHIHSMRADVQQVIPYATADSTVEKPSTVHSAAPQSQGTTEANNDLYF